MSTPTGADAALAPVYPLRFESIHQYRLWGGRRLADLLAAPLPGDGPIGEAWVLSGRDDHASRVANGPLKGVRLDHASPPDSTDASVAIAETGRSPS